MGLREAGGSESGNSMETGLEKDIRWPKQGTMSAVWRGYDAGFEDQGKDHEARKLGRPEKQKRQGNGWDASRKN